MKKYRCIYRSPRGHTVLIMQADNAEQAMRTALHKVAQKDATRIEVWDETGLVQSRVRTVNS